MSRPAVTVLVTTPLPEAGRKMLDERVHRLVVVDDDHRPVGVLSAIDFVQIVADD